jgi:hypothetical protein
MISNQDDSKDDPKNRCAQCQMGLVNIKKVAAAGVSLPQRPNWLAAEKMAVQLC